MNGGQLHEWMIDVLDADAQTQQLSTHRQYSVRTEETVGFIDLLVQGDGWQLAVEIERSLRRVKSDCRKANALQAEMWIVFPVSKLARKAKRVIPTFLPSSSVPIFALTFGAARTRIRELSR